MFARLRIALFALSNTDGADTVVAVDDGWGILVVGEGWGVLVEGWGETAAVELCDVAGAWVEGTLEDVGVGDGISFGASPSQFHVMLKRPTLGASK